MGVFWRGGDGWCVQDCGEREWYKLVEEDSRDAESEMEDMVDICYISISSDSG